ncbi:MAG: DUF4430 domain-containing protein [Minisyncoccia bacterium]
MIFVIAFLMGAKTASKNIINSGLNQDSTENDIAGDNYDFSYSFNSQDSGSNVFSGLLIYAKDNNFEVEYNNNYDYGVFVESIDGIRNGDEGKYWQYYVNGSLGDVAADKKILQEGDRVEWRFEEAPY